MSLFNIPFIFSSRHLSHATYSCNTTLATEEIILHGQEELAELSSNLFSIMDAQLGVREIPVVSRDTDTSVRTDEARGGAC